jgi:hypothetical protein
MKRQRLQLAGWSSDPELEWLTADQPFFFQST